MPTASRQAAPRRCCLASWRVSFDGRSEVLILRAFRTAPCVLTPNITGARQGSCRLGHAANGWFSRGWAVMVVIESRSGLRVTAPMGRMNVRSLAALGIPRNWCVTERGKNRRCSGQLQSACPRSRTTRMSSVPGRRAAEPKQAHGPRQAAVQTIKVIEIASRRGRQSEHGMPLSARRGITPFARPMGDCNNVMRKTHRN